MSNKKQSSIEWLIEQIIKEKGLVDLDIQAAKELHNQEIKEAYSQGAENEFTMGGVSSGDYYKDTYETDN